jgi:hypothetical protein
LDIQGKDPNAVIDDEEEDEYEYDDEEYDEEVVMD